MPDIFRFFFESIESLFLTNQILVNQILLVVAAVVLAMLIAQSRTLRHLLTQFRQELNLSTLLSRLIGVPDSGLAAGGRLGDFFQAISDVVWMGAQAKYVVTFQLKEDKPTGFITGSSPGPLIAYFASDRLHQPLWKEEPLVFKSDSDKVQALLKGQPVVLRDLGDILEPGSVLSVLKSLAQEWRAPGCFAGTFMVGGKPFGGFICGISRRQFSPDQLAYLDRVQRLSCLLLESFTQQETRKLLLEALTRKQERLRLLNWIAQAINACQDRPSLIRESLQQLEHLYPDLPVGICLNEDQSTEYSLAGCNAACSRSLPGGDPFPDRVTLSPELAQQLSNSPAQSFLNLSPSEVPLPFHTSFPVTIFPIATSTRRFGFCLVAPSTSAPLSPEDIEFFQFFTEHLALGLQNAETTSRLQEAFEQLRSSQEAMMRQENLRVLGHMATAITHDLNNLLSPLFAYIDLALSDPSLSEESRNYLKTAQTAAENMAEVVRRIREFYRKAPSAYVPVNIPNLIQKAILLTEPRWKSISSSTGAGIKVRTTIEPDLPEIQGAEGELLHALVNLIINALDAMPSRGTLTICAYRDSPHPSFRGREPSEAVAIEVCDEGVGMPPETLRRASEPFFTTKEQTGSGIGLASVRSTVERHNGVMEIESTPGRGTVVRLLLPVSPTRTVPVPEPTVPAPLTHAIFHRILVVEDEPLVLQAISEILRKKGHRVLTAGSSREALDIFKDTVQAGSPPDIVITDLRMPGMDGATLAQHIKRLSRETRIILLTGSNSAEAVTPLPSEIDVLLHKPVRETDLLSVISSVTSSSS